MNLLQIQTQILILINKSEGITFQSNAISGSLTLKSQDDIELITKFDNGDFGNNIQFNTPTYDFKIDALVNFTLTIRSTGDHYASYNSYIEYNLGQNEVSSEAIVYEDNYNIRTQGYVTLIPFLIKIFQFINCLKNHYYYRNNQIVIFAQTHCEIPIQPRQTEKYLQIAKECLVSEGLSASINDLTHWLNADISGSNDEIKKSLLVHETERSTIVASVFLENLVGQTKEDRIFSLIRNIEGTLPLILSKYSLYLDDFKFSKFNDKIAEHAEKFLVKTNDIITSLQTQILAIPLAIAVVSISKTNIIVNDFMVGCFLIYSVMVLYSTFQQAHNLCHLYCQIRNFVDGNKIPETLIIKWNEDIKPINRKIYAHAIYLLLVISFIIFVAINCMDYLFEWPTTLPLDLLINT